jgi:hypothetical protein
MNLRLSQSTQQTGLVFCPSNSAGIIEAKTVENRSETFVTKWK